MSRPLLDPVWPLTVRGLNREQKAWCVCLGLCSSRVEVRSRVLTRCWEKTAGQTDHSDADCFFLNGTKAQIVPFWAYQLWSGYIHCRITSTISYTAVTQKLSSNSSMERRKMQPQHEIHKMSMMSTIGFVQRLAEERDTVCTVCKKCKCKKENYRQVWEYFWILR